MREIKRVKKISVANVLAFIYGVLGFVLSISFYLYFTISALLNDHVVGPVRDFVLVNLMSAFVLGLGVALASGICGWILGLFLSFLYNFFAQRFSGIKIDTKDNNQLSI